MSSQQLTPFERVLALALKPGPNPTLDRALEAEAQRRRDAEEVEAARARRDEIQEQCKTLRGFVTAAWPILEPDRKLLTGFHIDAVCEHLEAVSRGQITRLAINIPPGFMKSLLCSVFWPAWEWGPFGRPSLSYLTASYEKSLAIRDNDRMRLLVASPWFQGAWGDHCQLKGSGQIKFSNSKLGWRWARAFLSLTGGRADRVIVDDPHSTQTAESDVQRKRVTTAWREQVQNRVNNPKRSAILLVMQRLHAQDVSGVIDELGMPYERLILPMEFESARRCVTSIGFRDPRRREGELLMDPPFDAQWVAETKKGSGEFAWAGQYQQRPVPREGGMFKREWFEGKLLRVAPAGTRWVRHWDLAATELKVTDLKGARTAGVKLGRAPDGSFIVADAIAEGRTGAKVRRLIKATAEIDGKQVVVSLPQDPGQAGKVQKADYAALMAGWDVRFLNEGAIGDKVTRAEPFSAQCEAGNVYLLQGAWNREYLDEICLFPGGARKDLVDASSGAFARLVGPATAPPRGGLAGLEIITADEERDFEEEYG